MGSKIPVLRMRGFPGGSVIKNPPASAGDPGSILGSGRSSRRKWQWEEISSILAWKSYEQSSLMGYGPWSRTRVRHDLTLLNDSNTKGEACSDDRTMTASALAVPTHAPCRHHRSAPPAAWPGTPCLAPTWDLFWGQWLTSLMRSTFHFISNAVIGEHSVLSLVKLLFLPVPACSFSLPLSKIVDNYAPIFHLVLHQTSCPLFSAAKEQ